MSDIKKSIVSFMNQDSVLSNIKETLGRRTPQFITSVASLVASNPRLQECDPRSIMSACLIAANLDLPVNQNLGFTYIIPYKDKERGPLAQFQMGYKGFIQLALRTNQYKLINVTDVREGENNGLNRLTGEYDFRWLPEDIRESKKVVGYVSHMSLLTGFSKSLYMSIEELSRHGLKYSKQMQMGTGQWKSEFDVMARKTVIKLLLSKFAPLTSQLSEAQLADQAVIIDGKYEYLDNKFVDPREMAYDKEKKRILDHIKNSKTLEELEKVVEYIGDYDLTKEYSEIQDEIKFDLSQEKINNTKK